MMGEPTPQERKLIERRIRAVSSYKAATGGDVLPYWLDLDELCPGTSDVGTGKSDRHLATYDVDNRQRWAETRRSRTMGKWDESTLNRRLRTLAAYKAARNGIVGLSVTRHRSVKCSYDGVCQGYFPTFREAADVYDRLARKFEKDRAILNDPEAVTREDRRLEVAKRMKAQGGKTARFAGDAS